MILNSRIALLAFILLFLQTGVAIANSDFYLKMLFTPSEGSLQAEANGRVMVYDSLESETIDLAMNQQFERIENMMFVRTQYVEDGEIEVIDDGCD